LIYSPELTAAIKKKRAEMGYNARNDEIRVTRVRRQ